MARSRALYDSCHNTVLLARWLALEAEVHAANGAGDAACVSLRRALELTRPGRIVRVFADVGASLIPMLEGLELEGNARSHAGRVLASLRGRPRDGGSARRPEQPVAGRTTLTRREAEVLDLLAERMTDREIAGRLFISPGTVQRHTQNLYGKLQVHGRREAVKKAIGLGLLASR